MCDVEFDHFVRNTGVLVLPRDAAAIPRILKAVNASRSTDNGNTVEVLTQFEFIEALVACAVHKYTAGTGAHVVASQHAARSLHGLTCRAVVTRLVPLFRPCWTCRAPKCCSGPALRRTDGTSCKEAVGGCCSCCTADPRTS